MDALDFTQILLFRENRPALASKWAHDLRGPKQTHNSIKLDATAKSLPLGMAELAGIPIGGLYAVAEGVGLHGDREDVGGITCCTSL